MGEDPARRKSEVAALRYGSDLGMNLIELILVWPQTYTDGHGLSNTFAGLTLSVFSV